MKTSQNLDRAIKKDRTVFTSSAQVYVRNTCKTITEVGRFTNGPCTSVQIVSASFTTAHDKSCENGARS